MAGYGSPPYQESLLRSALRLASGAASGLGAVRPGSNFGDAFMASAGQAFRASTAAHLAAQEYAMKQQEMELNRMRAEEYQRQNDIAAENAKKPPKPEAPSIHNMTPEQWQQYLKRVEEEAKAKAAGRPQKPGANGRKPAPPKPPKPREAVLKRIDLINQADMSNPEHVKRIQSIIANPATKEEQMAAEAKLNRYIHQMGMDR